MHKILFFIPSLCNSGGTERISTILANNLVSRGICVDFVVHSVTIDSFFDLDDSIHIYSLGFNGNINANKLKAALRLRKLIKLNHYNVIVNVGVACSCITFLSAPYLIGCKIISWEHFSICGLNFLGRLNRYLAVCLSKRTIVLTHADKFAYPRVLRKKIKVIPNFTCINKEGNIASLESKIVLAAGRIEVIKGFDLLIEAWKEVKNYYPNWSLRIVGGGCTCDLMQKVKKYNLEDVIYLVGPTTNMDVEYKKSSIFVLSSRAEPFGLVVIEAMSFGVPVVSFDCPNGPREIIDDGIDGLLVENGNVNALSAAIMKMIADQHKRKRMGRAAIQKYNNKFTVDKAITIWLSIL